MIFVRFLLEILADWPFYVSTLGMSFIPGAAFSHAADLSLTRSWMAVFAVVVTTRVVLIKGLGRGASE